MFRLLSGFQGHDSHGHRVGSAWRQTGTIACSKPIGIPGRGTNTCPTISTIPRKNRYRERGADPNLLVWRSSFGEVPGRKLPCGNQKGTVDGKTTASTIRMNRLRQGGTSDWHTADTHSKTCRFRGSRGAAAGLYHLPAMSITKVRAALQPVLSLADGMGNDRAGAVWRLDGSE